MRLDLLFPSLPPALDGIGDHTAHLARAAAEAGADVRVLTAMAAPDPIPGVRVERAFESPLPLAGAGPGRPNRIGDVLAAIERDPPDWLLLQFQQFSYGRYGFNPWLPLALRRLRRTHPHVRLAVMMHEDFVPLTSWTFAVMTLWQRAQFVALGRLADALFFSIQPWADRYGRWFRGTPAYHLPAGSNLPTSHLDPAAARAAFGLPPGAFLVGFFGTMGAARMAPRIRAAVDALRARDPSVEVVYVGPNRAEFDAAFDGVPRHALGALPGPEAAGALRALDLHLAPFIDGVSTRRGSFLAGLQQGVATVGTDGALTDGLLRDAAPEAFRLAPVPDAAAFVAHALALHADPAARAATGAAGRAFFDAHFPWPTMAHRFLAALAAAPVRR